MYATDYFETLILNLARGVSATAPQTMYLALYLNDPSDTGGGTEVSKVDDALAAVDDFVAGRL